MKTPKNCWKIGAVIGRGKRTATILQISPNIVARIHHGGMLIKRQDSLESDGWRLMPPEASSQPPVEEIQLAIEPEQLQPNGEL